jgi:hypothetical protein
MSQLLNGARFWFLTRFFSAEQLNYNWSTVSFMFYHVSQRGKCLKKSCLTSHNPNFIELSTAFGTIILCFGHAWRIWFFRRRQLSEIAFIRIR